MGMAAKTVRFIIRRQATPESAPFAGQILNGLTESGDPEFHHTCLGCDGTGLLLVDAHFVVVSIPAIAAGPKEREVQRSGLTGVYGNIDKINSDSSRS